MIRKSPFVALLFGSLAFALPGLAQDVSPLPAAPQTFDSSVQPPKHVLDLDIPESTLEDNLNNPGNVLPEVPNIDDLLNRPPSSLPDLQDPDDEGDSDPEGEPGYEGPHILTANAPLLPGMDLNAPENQDLIDALVNTQIASFVSSLDPTDEWEVLKVTVSHDSDTNTVVVIVEIQVG